MKKSIVLLVVAILFNTTNLLAQDLGANEKFIYCEIVGTGKLMSSKITISLDFGQATKFFSDKRLRDENNKPIVFNSMVDAMNWMGNDGWEFLQAYVVSSGNNQNVYHWLLKKDITKLSEEDLKDIISKFKTKD